jgi:hypothetical protein
MTLPLLSSFHTLHPSLFVPHFTISLSSLLCLSFFLSLSLYRLDQQLQARQARETGICPVREELYSQALDELIRQITINCAERGLLLLRVRDEAHMTISAYETLYESSIAYGVRKALVAEQVRSATCNSRILTQY